MTNCGSWRWACRQLELLGMRIENRSFDPSMN
jgi:hypothetical protein